MKQSAVEWLAEVVAKMGYVSTDVLEQAKAMEKEQIILAHNDFSENKLGELLTGEQYYNKTYKTK